jgi:hypothetical protein
MKAKNEIAGARSIKLFKQDERDLSKLAQQSSRSVSHYIRLWVHEKLEAVRRNGFQEPTHQLHASGSSKD